MCTITPDYKFLGTWAGKHTEEAHLQHGVKDTKALSIWGEVEFIRYSIV